MQNNEICVINGIDSFILDVSVELRQMALIQKKKWNNGRIKMGSKTKYLIKKEIKEEKMI